MLARPLLLVALFVALAASGQGASAQVKIVDVSSSDLARKPVQEQAAVLADVVRGAGLGWKCAQARASLEKTYKGGGGGWLVQCIEGVDHWVVMPAQAGKGAITLPCSLARKAGTDCYANFKTVLPEHAGQCTRSPQLDRVISACTSIIQSGRLDDKPTALAAAYRSRAVAFGKYQLLDIALSDFDRAVALDPNNLEGLYNRAVTLERKGDFDRAIVDLNKVLAIEPGHAYSSFERGYVYLKKKNYERAISDFDQAIRANPSFAQAYRQRAEAYKAKGEIAKAEMDARKATELGGQPRR